MATLNDYFRTEARELLRTIERGLQRVPEPDVAQLHRAVRGLRGTAQLARDHRVFDAAAAFESATRLLAVGTLAWSDDVAQRTRATISDLRALVDGSAPDEQLDERTASVTERWRSVDATHTIRAQPAAGGGTREFREFAAREVAGIAEALDRGVQELVADPMDRAPLRAILRRQRALLGAARLEEIPVVAEVLRAVEDLTRIVVKLDVGVKREWLDVYRVARDGIQSTITPLENDELPEPTHAVSRLRHMHCELIERYGTDGTADENIDTFVDPAALSRAAEMPAAAQAPAAPPPPAPQPAPPMPPAQPAPAPAPAAQAPAPAPPPTHAVPTAQPFAPRPVMPPRPTMPFATPAPGAPASHTPPAPGAHPFAPFIPRTATPTPVRPVAPVEPAPPVVPAAAVVDETMVEVVLEDVEAEELVLEDIPYDELDGDDAGVVLELDEVSVEPDPQEALDRALAMHAAIARAVDHDPRLRAMVAELFDLLRIARG